MAVIDEQGRVFGLVNVIDLAVALLVLATLVAGAAVVLLDDPEPPEQRYVTVVLEERPTSAVQTLDGASAQLGGTDARITDAYRAPTADHGVTTVLRLRVSVSQTAANQSTDTRLVTDRSTYLVGEELGVTSGEASYVGHLSDIDSVATELRTRRVNTTVVTRAPPSVADRVEPGDTQRIAGTGTARVLAVENRTTAANRTRLAVTLSLRVLDREDGLRYGDRVLRPGADLPFATDEYEFEGTVTGVERDT